MRYRFVHASDLHLDTPLKGLAEIDASIAERVRDASLDALDRIVERAIAAQALFVVFAGDVYDGADRGLRAQLRFRDALARLDREGIQSFVVHGNHDPEGGRWSAVERWPDGAVFFPPGNCAAVRVERDGHTLAVVHGISYPTRHVTDNLALRFPHAEPGVFSVAVLHTLVAGQGGHDAYSPCTLEDLRSRGMDYWALGHVHTHQVLHRDPWIVYSGNTQGRSFAPAELGPKGAVLVEVEDGHVAELTWFPTDSARFEIVTVTPGEGDDAALLVETLQQRAHRLRDEASGVLWLLRARVQGRSPLFHTLRSPDERRAILDALRDGAPPDVWWADLDDATAPPFDLARIARGGDLRASVLETWRRWKAAGADRQAFVEAASEWLRPGGMAVDALSEAALDELLDEALHEVLDRLTAPGE